MLTPLVLIALVLSGQADECSRTLDADPYSRDAARCFQKSAESTGDWAGAAKLLEAAEAAHPAAGWISFYRADVLSRLRSPDALPRYRTALGKFVARADAAGETEARIAWGDAALEKGQRAEAWAEAPLAQAAARRTGDWLLIARALLFEGWLVQSTGERLAHGIRVLREAEALAFPGGPYGVKKSVLGGLAYVSYSLGRFEEARTHYSAQMELARQNNDDATAVKAAVGAMTARRRQLEELPEPGRLAELTVEARSLASLADAANRPVIQAMANRTLADFTSSNPDTRADAEPIYRRALQQAQRGMDAAETAMCLWALGRYLSTTNPVEARRLVDDALKAAVDSGSSISLAFAWRQKMRLAMQELPRAQAVPVALDALKAIETLREQQAPDLTRAAFLSAWTLDYYWLIGTLLDRDTPPRSDIALAFEIGERMRARLLLDALRRQTGSNEDSKERRQWLREISGVQRRLLDPRLSGPERDAAVAELERLEREEVPLPRNLTAEPDSHTFASLEATERALGSDEALLTFSTGLWKSFYGHFAGGSWLLVSTNAGTTAIRAPDRVALHPKLSIFRGLLEQADEVDPRAAAALHGLLLEKALGTLPKSIARLIIVPDGPLHHLPFAALLPAQHVSLVPSATVWLRSRQVARQPARSAALVFADPRPDARRATIAEERGWWMTAAQAGSLPFSRTEGRAIVSHMGRGSSLLIGAEATESSLKSRDLGEFGVLHFATHTLVDDGHPDRSAVLLAGGRESEDGLLQPREIADLKLAGKIVVLSSCRSATGAVLSGEGVVGLSHAFLRAGARVVVGTLWPVRDDHAAAFFDLFYAELGRGRDVGSALTEARRRAISRGLPAAAWSSVVAVGDVTAAVPARPPATSGRILPVAIVVLTVIGVAILFYRLFTRPPTPRRPEDAAA